MALIGVAGAVSEIQATLVANISELSTERCVHADLDKLMASVEANVGDSEARYACLYQFLEATHRPMEPFSNEIWAYTFSGILMIRLNDLTNIETEMVSIIDKVRSTGGNFPRGVNQTAALFRIYNIQKPIPTTIADTPYYFLPFMIRIFDK